MRHAPLAAVLLVGCGYSEATFQEEYVEVYCAWTVDCQFYDDESACREAYSDFPAADRSDCEYDGRAARDCVNELDALECPTVENEPIAFPNACNAVWTCPDEAGDA